MYTSRMGKVGVAVLLFLVAVASAWGQQPASTSQQGFGFKIYRVESGAYPFVQVYMRTFDQNMRPLLNLNEANLGIMVKGRSYDPMKRQYRIESLANRQEPVRSVLVLDCSGTMVGAPFEAAMRAVQSYIASKRLQDQVAILAIRDTDEGYELVSNFERDPTALARRLGDVRCDGTRTRLYDAIAGALQMCAMPGQGGTQSDQAEYAISNSVVVFSDGKDEGSALTREELNARITQLAVPIPIYSIAYTKVDPMNFRNLEALSKNSFGVYFNIGESYGEMQRSIEDILNILQNDYVVVVRSYVPIDGEEHAIKVGIEYPSRSGQMTYQSAKFEALEPPAVEAVLARVRALEATIPALADNNPYLGSAAAPAAAPAAPEAPAAPPAASAEGEGEEKEADAAPVAASDEAVPETLMDRVKSVSPFTWAVIGGVLGFVVIVLAVVMLLKRGRSDRYVRGNSSRATTHSGRMTVESGSGGHEIPSGESTGDRDYRGHN